MQARLWMVQASSVSTEASSHGSKAAVMASPSGKPSSWPDNNAGTEPSAVLATTTRTLGNHIEAAARQEGKETAAWRTMTLRSLRLFIRSRLGEL